MLLAIDDALIEKGYKLTKESEADWKAALVNFQKDNGLPIGQFDMETLDVLGVAY